MNSNVEQVTQSLNEGAAALDAMPTGRIESDMRRLHTDDILRGAATAVMRTGHVREAIKDLLPSIGEATQVTTVVRELWATALAGANSDDARELQERTDELAGGKVLSMETLVRGGVHVEAKLTEVEGLAHALLKKVEELDDLRATWQYVAEGVIGEAGAVAQDARNLAARMGGEAPPAV